MRCRQDCEQGKDIAIFHCDESPTQWVFVEHGNNDVQIQAVGTGVCMQVQSTTNRTVLLDDCDNDNIMQRFQAASPGSLQDVRFEIEARAKAGWCLTQRHHPREGEEIRIERCTAARKSNTSFWNKV